MNKTNEILFRDANLADAEALGAMLPQLADFDIPSKRLPEQLCAEAALGILIGRVCAHMDCDCIALGARTCRQFRS